MEDGLTRAEYEYKKEIEKRENRKLSMDEFKKILAIEYQGYKKPDKPDKEV